MATFTVVPGQRQPGYRVDVVTDDGSRHSVLSFNTETEDEAYEWIGRIASS